jgi:hypothetical protein
MDLVESCKLLEKEIYWSGGVDLLGVETLGAAELAKPLY